LNNIIKIPSAVEAISDREETQVRRITYAIRTPMLMAKRHFVTGQDISAMPITLTEARGADLRPNYRRARL
jgi:hypothetical protein